MRSPYPDVTVPEVPLTPFVLQRAGELATKPAVVDGPSGRSLSYEQLAGAVGAMAGGLAERGFGKGDVFAIFCPNVPEYAVAFHGVASAGGVTTTVNPLYTADELASQLRDARATYLLTVPLCLDRALEGARRSGVEEVFVLGQAEGATPFSSLLQGGATSPGVEIDPGEDLVALPYSSGTTGLSKGVMLTHRNLVANICQVLPPVHHGSTDDRILGVLPFFHIYGMTVIMNTSIFLGATVVTLPRFDLEQLLGVIQHHRITRAYLVPPIILALAKHPVVDRFDLSSLELILSGAAPLGAEVARACSDRLGCAVLQGYGLTETSPVTHVVSDLPGMDKPGSVGPPVPNTECKVVGGDAGAELGQGELGEIWIRGPQVMKGYLNDPAATASTLDGEGWLHTGDVGHSDGDGYLYVVDRLKELIKYKGFQVAPAELEALLLTHPAVADAAVVPSPDPEAGEIPKAFLVLRGEAAPEDVMAYVADRVAPHKKVRAVELVDAIPKSPSGKILRRLLVERERSRLQAQGPA